MLRKMRSFLKANKGQGLPEYVLLLVIIVILVIAVGKLLGPQITDLVKSVLNNLKGAQNTTF